MVAFSISDAAADEIRRRFRQSELENPTASLIDSSPATRASPQMIDALSRKASDSQLLDIVAKEHLVPDRLAFRLDVGIYPSEKCRPSDLLLVDAVQFVMSKTMHEFLADHLLDFAAGHFVLRNGSRVVPRMADVWG